MTSITDEKTGVTPETDRRAEYVKGLRALAEILEQHPELPLPYDGRGTGLNFIEIDPATDRRGAAAFARLMPGTVRKEPRGEYFDLLAEIHGVKVKWIAQRVNVCERVVIATREVEVEEPDPAAVAALPKVVRTEVVEDVEWICHSILAGEQPESADQAEAVA